MNTRQSACETCNKSTLSLLLLRPSPIPKDPDLKPVLSDRIETRASLIANLVPTPMATESRYGLRLLRPGYVHVYIPDAPAPMRSWLTYRVTEQADLIEELNPLFKSQVDVSCTSKHHNTMGMKLLSIPQAHKIPGIWIAFSANLWNDKIRARCQANPLAMQYVSLMGGSPNTFKPTQDELAKLVVECEFGEFKMDRDNSHDFAYNSLSAGYVSLANNLKRAAECHPKTVGKELAVVLNDPLGVAAELNGLRIRRHDVAQEFPLERENRQPFEVNRAIQLFKGNVIADVGQKAMESISPVMSEGQFKDNLKSNPYEWPEGTRWEPLPDLPWFKAAYGNFKGSLVFPDHEDRAMAWAKEQAKATWSRMEEYYDEGARKAWVDDFLARFDRRHAQSLLRYERDWEAALKWRSLHDYFTLHFDSEHADAPGDLLGTGCSPGYTYCHEVWLAYTPEPFSREVLPTLLAQLDMDVREPNAHMKRALFGNQSGLWENLFADSGDGDGRRDKTYDFIKGLIGETKGMLEERFGTKTKTHGVGLPPVMAKRYAFLSSAMLGFSGGIVSALGAVVAAHVAEMKLPANRATRSFNPVEMARLTQVQRMTLLHAAGEEALRYSLNGGSVNVPVLLEFDVDADTMTQIQKDRGQPAKRRAVKQWYRDRRAKLCVITDSQTIREMPKVASADADLKYHLAVQAREIFVGGAAAGIKAGKVPQAVKGELILMPMDKFRALYQVHRAKMEKVPVLAMGWLMKFGESLKARSQVGRLGEFKASMSNVDYRLGVGSVIVQGLGLLNGMLNWWAADLEGSADKAEAAYWGMMDSVAGVLGGTAEMMAVAYEAQLLKAGESAVARSMGLPLLRSLGFGAGVAGNVINAYMSFKAAGDQEASGNLRAANFLKYSGVMFFGGAFPLGILVIQGGLQALVARRLIYGMGAVMVEQLAVIMGARTAVTLFISIPGWGMLITAAGVGTVAYVAMNTPTPFQNWLKGSYFGKPEAETYRRRSWDEEKAALELLEKGAEADAKYEQTRGELGHEPQAEPPAPPSRLPSLSR